MWTKPPLHVILIALLMTGLFSYIFYQIWFGTEQLYQKYSKRINNLPSWYPFKKHYLWQIQNKKNWIMERRVVSIIVMLFILLFDGLIVIAVLYGK